MGSMELVCDGNETVPVPSGSVWLAAEAAGVGESSRPGKRVQMGFSPPQLSGDPSYDPTLPWVSKLRRDGVMLVAVVHQFVDDFREIRVRRPRKLG